VYDILSIGEGLIIPGDGGSYHRVQFRLVVFRPFIGEVIVGKIKASAPAGIQGAQISFFFFGLDLSMNFGTSSFCENRSVKVL
jgi:DNA-directed RNA polymerase III subunit RPC8